MFVFSSPNDVISNRPMMRGARPLAAVLLAGASLIATAAAAAEAQADADADAYLDITEITVSATKSPVEAFSVPSSVSVISKDEINDFMAASIADIFQGVPGLAFTGGPRRTGDTPALRGTSGEGVVVLFDGVRQSFLSGHDGRFFIEPDLLKSAEVVRGSGSSLYGSGAIGGVITFNTVDAADLLEEDSNMGYRVTGGYQDVSEEWMGGFTLFGRSDDERFDGLASLSFRDSGDIALGNGTSLQADDQIGSGIIKLGYQATDALRLEASWMGYRNDAREPNNGQGNNVGDLVDKDVVSDTFRLGIEYNPASDLVDLAFVGYVNNANVEEAEIDSDRVINRDVETLGFSIDNRSRFTLDDRLSMTLTVGAEYYEDEQVGTDNTTQDGTRGGVPNADAETLGLFIQAEITADTPVGDFTLIPGVRYDDFKNQAVGHEARTDASATSPKVALSWQPVEELVIFSSYGEGFRAPSFNEIFADDIHFIIPLGPFTQAPNFFVPNADLRPERSKTWEFGAGVDFVEMFTDGDRFTFKGAYFTSDVEDLIDLSVNMAFSPQCFAPMIPGPCTSGTSQNVNTGMAELDGFEFEAVYDAPRVRATAAYSAIDGIDAETGDFVGILQPNRLFMTGELKLPEIDARFGTRVTFAGAFDKVNNPADARDSYETVDLFIVWTPDEGPLEGLRVDVGVDNVFDAAAETVFAGVFDAGRNVKARFSWTGSF